MDALRRSRINQPLDQRFGSVNEFRTDAGSNYTGLQTSATKQFGGSDAARKLHLQPLPRRGIEWRPASLLHVSAFSLHCRAICASEYGNCDYDVRHNLSAFGIYEIPFHSSHALSRYVLGGWQVSQTAIPAQRSALQRAQRALHGEQPRHLPGQRAAVCQPGCRAFRSIAKLRSPA